MNKAYLVLEDGTVFEGFRFGSEKNSVGELVFSTGMCSYIETLTDPSYAGQIVMQTFPLIGNYGIIDEDFEGKCAVRGYVVREYCNKPSNFRSGGTIDEFLMANGVPGICGVDTRELTKIIREHGVMNAYICDKVPEDLSKIKNYRIENAVESVTSREFTTYPSTSPDGEKYFVVLIDYGAKNNIIRSLTSRGCKVRVVPAGTKAEDILTLCPDGIMLSNGPGDPSENTFCIEQIKELMGKVPMFGICLGHQLMALSAGASTVKLKYGHRGGNQPVRDLSSGRTYITSQNHGYAVESDSIKTGSLRFINANDGTCEGIDYPFKKAFSVQFHPEACAGPHDTDFLFDRFTDMMKGGI
ncbi:MAG: carbamoyl phosphate synthase small subunit [Eubacteriales bacterium]